jgi:uncharacterized protein involved in response to NO
MTSRPAFKGPALFSYGFRPFFGGASLYALIVVPVWLLLWEGSLQFQGHFPEVDWHIHEMIFGYGSAVLAGFLFTAVPNWTGRMPIKGWPLAFLFLVWILGRLVLWGAGPLSALSPAVVLAVDGSFLILVAAMIAREVIAGQNWRNLKVLVPVLLLAAGNILYHLEVMLNGYSEYGRRLGIALLVFLIMLIGGRIIPSFTRNWLVKERGGDAPMPIPFSRFDGVSLVTGALALIAWVLLPETPVAGVFLMQAGVLHVARLTRWRGISVLASPLLVMLHLAYFFVPIGFLVSGFAAFGLMEQVAAVHLMGIGAVGGMTMAVMMRASLGHTGRPLVAGWVLNLAFAFLLLAAVVRVAGSALPMLAFDAVHMSGSLWTLGFALMCLRLVPWLLRKNPARRKPNPAPNVVPRSATNT